MPRNGLKCGKCGRSFALPMHLGRHMVAVHGGKPAKAKPARASAARPAPTPRPPAFAGGSNGTDAVTGDLVRNIQTARASLLQQQAHVTAQIAALDQFLATLGVGSPAAGRSLPRRLASSGGGAREGSLKSYISRVLESAGRPMRVAEIADAVRKAGFKTRNKTLAKSVGNMLVDMPNVKKVDRGIFAAR